MSSVKETITPSTGVTVKLLHLLFPHRMGDSNMSVCDLHVRFIRFIFGPIKTAFACFVSVLECLKVIHGGLPVPVVFCDMLFPGHLFVPLFLISTIILYIYPKKMSIR